MLRLKTAINDCGIPQKELVAATGFGKSQISQTLSTGKLPADAQKFKDGIYRLVTEENGLAEWLAANNLSTDQLFDTLPGPADDQPPAAPAPANSLRHALYQIVGAAVLNAPAEVNGSVVRMAHSILYLQDTLSGLVGEDAPYVLATENEVADILTGAGA